MFIIYYDSIFIMSMILHFVKLRLYCNVLYCTYPRQQQINIISSTGCCFYTDKEEILNLYIKQTELNSSVKRMSIEYWSHKSKSIHLNQNYGMG